MGSGRVGSRRPPVAVVASVPKGTSRVSRIDIPAAHASTQTTKKSQSVTGMVRSSYIVFLNVSLRTQKGTSRSFLEDRQLAEE